MAGVKRKYGVVWKWGIIPDEDFVRCAMKKGFDAEVISWTWDNEPDRDVVVYITIETEMSLEDMLGGVNPMYWEISEVC